MGDFTRIVHGHGSLPCPAIVLIALYFVGNAFHAYLVGAVDAMKILMESFGVGSALSEEDRAELLSKLTNIAFATHLFSALPVGIALDLLGPKVVCLFGVVANCSAISLYAFSNATSLHYVAAALQGFVGMSVANGHYTLSALFPKAKTGIIGFLGAGANLSCFVPIFLTGVGSTFQSPSVACYLFIGICLVTFISDALFVPWRPITPSSEKFDALEKGEEKEPLLGGRRRSPSIASITPTPRSKGPFEDLNLVKQLMQPQYWAFAVYFTICVFRRNYAAQTYRKIFQEVAIDAKLSPEIGDGYTATLNYLLPFAFIVSITFGILADIVGLLPIIAVCNIFQTILFVFLAFFPPICQWISIVSFLAISGYLLSPMFAFVMTNFGVKHFGILQGLINCFAVLGIVSFKPYVKYVVDNFYSGVHRNSCVLLVIVSIVAFSLLGYLNLSFKRLSKNNSKNNIEE